MAEEEDKVLWSPKVIGKDVAAEVRGGGLDKFFRQRGEFSCES